MPLSIAIVGRPNVGKSTLFNRLTGKHHAIVHDEPGVTRDRREGEGSIGDLRFHLVDTPGLENAKKETLSARMTAQTEKAVQQADLCLFVVDGRAGITAEDRFFAQWLRKKNRPMLLVVNKCEGKAGQAAVQEATSLGFPHIIGISAAHGEGLDSLYEGIEPFVTEAESKEENSEEESDDPESKNTTLKLTIIGRPNAGKSTLINHWLKEDRLLTGPEAGITRDSISLPFLWKNQAIELIDTAGIRKRSKVNEALEKLSVSDALRAIRFSEVVVLLLDSDNAFEQQDVTLAHHVLEEGRCLIVGINKWDNVAQPEKTEKELRKRLKAALPLEVDTPFITLSALNGHNTSALLELACAVKKRWNTRIKSSDLNVWLKAAEEKHTPPLSPSGRRVRLKYITQTAARPPRFALFTNKPDDIPESYQRYLIHSLRDTYDFRGVPIRLMLRGGKNPYDKKKGEG